MTILTPGANAPVPSGNLTVLIRHGSIPGAEIDVSAFLVTATGKVRSDVDMCFYGQPSVSAGALTLEASKNGETRFTVIPAQISAEVEKVIFTATVHENQAAFGCLPKIGVDVSGVQGQIPCAGMTETALILAELYQRNGVWKVRIVGQGFNGGLGALAAHMGVDISEPTSPPAPVNLSKVSLTKQNSTVNLKKDSGRFGKIRVNLNWNQKTGKTGFFSRGGSNIDLDLAAFVELRNGKRDVVQALGKRFGLLESAPYVMLLGDDRTGAVSDGEWLEINGDKWSEISRILVFAFIYEGVPNWQETDGIIRVLVPGQPEIEVRMNEFGDKGTTCAVATLENQGGQVRVSRKVTFHNGHKEMDQIYDWGFQWTRGSK